MSPSSSAASPLWPLSFPEPLLQLVRSKLPSTALSALRLVNRAARDEFVDGRCTKVRPLRARASPAALLGAAPRLRSLVEIEACAPQARKHRMLSAAECETLLDVIERLPGGGAATLRELDICWAAPARRRSDGECKPADVEAAARCLARLAGALGRLRALESLDLFIEAPWSDGVAALFSAFACGASAQQLPALTRLGFDISFAGPPAPRPPPGALAALPPPAPALLARLEALSLGGLTSDLWLPLLLEGGAAAAEAADSAPLPLPLPLPRLRQLELSAWCGDGLAFAEPLVPWRAPWLSQLTRLVVYSCDGVTQRVAAAFAPGALPALRSLEVVGEAPSNALRSLIATCGSPGSAAAGSLLETLKVQEACSAPLAAAAAAGALPALRALIYDGSDLGGDGCGDRLRAFVAAPFAPLTRLVVDVDRCVYLRPAYRGLAALFRAPWARVLTELALRGLAEPDGAPQWAPPDMCGAPGLRVLYELQGLSALAALRRLELALHGEWAPRALRAAAKEGWADGWAPRLVEFKLRPTRRFGKKTLRALLRLPFSSRLERFEIVVPRERGCLSVGVGAGFGRDELTAADAAAACAAALQPWPPAVEFFEDECSGFYE